MEPLGAVLSISSSHRPYSSLHPCSAFWGTWCALPHSNFIEFFYFHHILICKSSFIYSAFFFLKWLFSSHSCNVFFYHSEIFTALLFPSSKHSVFSGLLFSSLLVCLVFFTWGALLMSVTQSTNFNHLQNTVPLPGRKMLVLVSGDGCLGCGDGVASYIGFHPVLFKLPPPPKYHAVNSCVWRESWM